MNTEEHALHGVARIRRSIAPYVTLLGFTVLVLAPIHGPWRLYWGDLLLYFEPMYGFGHDALCKGVLPLWNPLVLCGQPYIGNPQMSVFYPTTLLLPVLKTWDFIWMVDELHLFLCGAFTYLFLCRWTLRRIPALFGALIFEGSGSVVGRLQFPPMVAAMAYIPLLLALVDSIIDMPTVPRMGSLTIAIALILLAGHPQMAYFGLMLAMLYACARMLTRTRTAELRMQHPAGATVMALTVALVGGVMLAAVQLAPMAQLVLASPREELTAQTANRFVLQPEQLMTLVAPHFDGSPKMSDYWPDGNPWEPALFLGWAPVLLAGYAAVRCSRERCVRFWMVLALLGIWLAFGNVAGLYWLAFHVIPGLSNFHDPARFLILTALAIATLAAIGLDAICIRKTFSTWKSLTVLGLSIVIPLLVYASDWLPTAQLSSLAHRPQAAEIVLSGRHSETTGRVYQPEHQLFWNRFVTDGYADYGPREPQGLAAEIDTLLPNLNMRYGIPSASGYEPVPLSGPAGLDGLNRVALRRNEPNLTRLLHLMQVRWLILPQSEHLAAPGLNPTPKAEGPAHPLRIYTVKSVVPAAWIVHQIRRVDGAMRIVAVIAAPGFDPYRTAIVSGGSADVDRATSVSEASGGGHGATILAQTRKGDALKFKVDVGASPGLLVCAMAAYPGWRSTVDGKAVTPCRVDSALLGVTVPPGVHEVAIRYRPDVFQVGLFISLMAMTLLSIGVTISLYRRAISGKRAQVTVTVERATTAR